MSVISRRALLAACAATVVSPPGAAPAQHLTHGDPAAQSDIPGFDRYSFRFDGRGRNVYVQGAGAPVLLLHELPGLSWPTILLAQRLVNRGFRVHMPLLFGAVGQSSGVRGYFQSCFGSQFDCSDPDGRSRVLEWIHGLARDVADKERRPMAAIGMCLTGAFPLALMDIPEMTAAVISQPAVPLRGNTDARRRGLGLTPAEIARARDRADARFLALRFSADTLCPAERFETLERVLGGRVRAVVIPSGPGTEFPVDAHAVLSGWYPSDPASGTQLAFEDVVAFLGAATGGSKPRT